MVIEVIAGLVSAALIAIGALLWRNRQRLRLLRAALLHPFGQVRVSFCAVLKIRDDDRYILFEAPSRPNSYGPPGGVFKYNNTPEARSRLEKLGFQDERKPPTLAEDRRHDLRGFVGTRSAPGFTRWFNTAVDRESAADCLRRELVEELAEVGHPELVAEVAEALTLTFNHVRTIDEGPQREPGTDYLHLRRFEVYEITLTNEEVVSFQRRLVEFAVDPTSPKIVLASVDDIRYGRCLGGLIGGHSAYLFGGKRYHPSWPPLR